MFETIRQKHYDPIGSLLYYGKANEDFQNLCSQILYIFSKFSKWSFLENMIVFVDATEECVDASISHDADENLLTVKLSAGLMFALEDLSLRLFANKDFFSIQAFATPDRVFNPADNDKTALWPYAYCLERPKLRFFDYTSVTTDLPPSASRGASWLYRFVSAFPIIPERLIMSDLMTMIAVTWTIAHEVSHARKGHIYSTSGDILV